MGFLAIPDTISKLPVYGLCIENHTFLWTLLPFTISIRYSDNMKCYQNIMSAWHQHQQQPDITNTLSITGTEPKGNKIGAVSFKTYLPHWQPG